MKNMKRVLLSTAALLSFLGASSRELPHVKAENPAVTIRPVDGEPGKMSVRVGGYELTLEGDGTRPFHRKKYGGRIGTVELGFNGFRSTGASYRGYPAGEAGFMDLNMGKSFHLTVNVFTFSTSFLRDNLLGMTIGVGLTSNDYTFETPATYIKSDNMIRPVDPGYYLKKAKLHTLALHIPLALEVNPTRSFFVSVGGHIDLMLRSHLKWKSPKEKLRSPYTNFLQAGVTARIGFRHAYLMGSYNFVEMFKGGRGPALTPYMFGIGFGF